MTSRERIETVLNHREADRTPIFEYVLLSPVADAVLNRKYADFGGDRDEWIEYAREKGWENALRQYVQDRLDIACKLGHDMLYVVPNPLPEAVESKTCSDVGKKAESTPIDDDPVERLIERNKRREESNPSKINEDSFLVYEYLNEEMKKRGMDLHILAPGYFHGIWTDVDLMETMLIEPEVAHQHFSLVTKSALAYIEKYTKLGIKLIGVGGDFAGNRLLISPQSYKDFIVPEVRTLSQRIHETGGWAVNASDGDLWPVIEDFLLGCEVDGYLEIDMRAGMDLAKLKKSYGNNITFFGNMDCGEVLSFCSPEEVRLETIKCIEAGSGNGGHIFCASNAITNSIPLENYMTMVNTYRDIFGLSKVNL